ncbi:crotonase/enoyl-CoA hydratase family protein [Microbaculum marinisediminis]|uniref:crotonase/enoyl-CoA hydratase family protein n=1 Tax=Microbaculum marinisediminis TaxID=2931392 RepID=UPI003CC53CBF
MHGSENPSSDLPDLPGSLAAEVDGDIALLRLARPNKRNALDDPTVLGLEIFFTRLPEGVKAVVLSGEGTHFSAGLDLSELRERDLAEGIEHSRMWQSVFDKIAFGRVPVVSVLHGAVVGGGLELACATHIRVAERSAYYGLPEGQRGIFVGGGGSVRVPKLIGAARMMDMMLTGRVYDAAEGQTIGLSHYLVDDGAGLDKAKTLARAIASNAPLSNYAILQAVPRIAEAAGGNGYFTEALMAAVAQSQDEAKQRLRDFLEKRAPKVEKE